MAESSPYEYKTMWEKEKLLVTSNFSFPHGVFKRLVLQTRKNQGLFGKGLNKSILWIYNYVMYWSVQINYIVLCYGPEDLEYVK